MQFYKEWRLWPSGWSYTGTVTSDPNNCPTRPNSKFFPSGEDPNQAPIAPPPDQPINPGWLSAQVQHANRIIPRLAGKPQFRSLILELAQKPARATAGLAAISQDDGEDF
jgi:hypothetical protein